jgi:uracil-DNA glycosylase family 4
VKPQASKPQTRQEHFVVHCKRERFDVYIGRPSPFGNPFSHLPSTIAKFRVHSRDEAIGSFEKWLHAQPALLARVKRELKGKILGCFCAPQRCHGDVLARIANEKTSATKPAARQGPTVGGCRLCPRPRHELTLCVVHWAALPNELRRKYWDSAPGSPARVALEVEIGRFDFKTPAPTPKAFTKPARPVSAAERTLPLFKEPEHRCHALRCHVVVPPEQLMCRMHWSRVPREIQRRVWATYRKGQCEDRRPSKAWLEAADAAIAAVAALEKRAPIRVPLSSSAPLASTPVVALCSDVAKPTPKIIIPARKPDVLAKSSPTQLEKPRLKIVVPQRPKSSYDPRAHGALCDSCPCRGRPVVPPTLASPVGPPQAAIVGDEPGWEEMRQGRPFAGMAGKKLDKQLAKHNLNRTRFHITNAALCLPEKEEDFAKAFKCCKPRLEKELSALPQLTPVITLGAPAFTSAFGRKTSISKARGFVWTHKDGRTFLPTIHPRYVLRDAVQSPLWNLDWDRIARCLHNDGKIETLAPPSYDVPRTAKELIRSLKKFEKDEWVSLDVETTKDSPTRCELQCVGMSNGKDTIVLPWYPWAALILNKFFTTRIAVGHNIFAFDAIVLRRFGIELSEIEDTLIAHHAYASHFPQRMAHVMSVYADVIPWKDLYGLSGTDEKGLPKNNLSEEDLHFYNAHDAYYQAHLWILMRKDILANLELYNHDRENADLAREMTENGVLVDEVRRKEIADALHAKIDRLYETMRDLVGRDFAPTKTAEIRSILFEQFNAPVIEYTMKTGQPSTGKRTLQAFAVKVDLPFGQFSAALVKWRMCRKVLATHVEGLPIEEDGRVRAGWKSFGTPTGRISVKVPNLNNQKRADNRFKGEPEYRVREIYVPAKGNTFVAFDLEQIEPRMSSYLSFDVEFVAAVETGDIHTAIARIVFGENEPKLKDSKTAKTEGKFMRQVAKSLGLAVSYGAGADTLYDTLVADGFDVTLSRVVAMLETLKKRFKRYFEFLEEQIAFCRKHGYIIAGFASKRKRWLGHAPEMQKISNTPCQGGAADVINYRAIELRRLFKKKYGKPVKIIAQIYDSVIVECPKKLAGSIEADMRKVMGKPWVINGRSVVLPIEIKTGDRWSEV